MAFRTPWLFVGLMLGALIPSLILAAFALGLISMPESKPPVVGPAPQTAAPSAVLTAPDRIAAVAGADVSFPVALDGTDGVPPRSVVAIRGLPQGSNFSEGRPYGDGEWNLKPDQIGDLHLVLPVDAHGEFKLGIALIAPDDKVVAAAETLLKIAPAPLPAPAEPAAVPASGLPSPEGSEGTAAAAPPDAGDGVEPAATPAAMEAAAAPAEEALLGHVNQTTEKPIVPASDAPPATVGQPEDTGLGTVQPSVFVNLRAEPSSGAPVLGVIAKGAELSVLDRKRGWVQVVDPATAKKGWVYSGLLAGEAKTHHRLRRMAPVEAAPEPKSESLWSRLGRWLSP